MEIDETYTKKVDLRTYHVYVGKCDKIPTKWVTRTKWNYKINISYNKDEGELEYLDDKGKEILVYEKDEEEWEMY
jgi:hypothetical protein